MLLFKKKKFNINKPLNEKKICLSLLTIAVIAFAGGYLFAVYNTQENQIASPFDSLVNNQAVISPEIDFNLYWELWHKLKQEYVGRDQISERDLFYGSLRGLTAALDDPYTVFFDPEEAKEFFDDLAGIFEGIGAEIGLRDDIITIIAPLAGMPAEKAGLHSGDKVQAIDGESTIGMTINEAIRKIRGPKGTEVSLTIFREEEEKPLEFKIIRDLIVVKSVNWEKRPDNLFMIRISNFNDDTLSLFNQAVLEILNQDPQGLIVDLRNNPGGHLEAAVDLASEWVLDGPIVIEQLNSGQRHEYLADGQARLRDLPTVILVNGGSASASEIVAGALRDHYQAVIVGEQTFGKGSVQNLFDLSDGSSLKITVAEWLTPAGLSINDEGITPDFIIELSREDIAADRDPQLEKAVEILLTRE